MSGTRQETPSRLSWSGPLCLHSSAWGGHLMALFIPVARNSAGPVTTLLGTGLPHRYVDSNVDQGVLVLTIVPVQLLDDGLAAGFLEELVSPVAQTGAQKVVLDFRAVKSICSAVL